jgi:integrase
MANLRATIVIRTKIDNKSRWVVVDGKRHLKANPELPDGTFYLRYCQGSKPKLVRAGNTLDEALAAQIRMQRTLKAQSQGFIVPNEEVPADAKKLNRLQDVVDAYIVEISKPDNNNECRSQKSIKSSRSMIEDFTRTCGKTFIEELAGEAGRAAVIAYRERLYASPKKYERDTVHNKLLAAVSFLKNNSAFPILKILQKNDWPSKKTTRPDAYTLAEIDAMLKCADANEALVIRMFRSTGMRESELSHAEWEDINWTDGYIQVQRRKPKYNWRAKNDAACREIPLDDDLLADLKRLPPGLLFSNPQTRRVNGHILRMIKKLADMAGVVATTAKLTHKGEVRDNWCHRFRDFYVSARVAEAKNTQQLMTVIKQIGHSNLDTLRAYAETVNIKSQETRDLANKISGVKKPGPRLVANG